MPRGKKKNFKRDIGVDAVYGSNLVQKVINVIMKDGKKNVARCIVYGALEKLAKKAGSKDKALEYFVEVFDKITPQVEVRPRRMGGSVYQVPTELKKDRAQALAIRWIIGAAASRSDKDMASRLAHELMDAHEGRGGAVKKKMDIYRMAEANRAFSHYAW